MASNELETIKSFILEKAAMWSNALSQPLREKYHQRLVGQIMASELILERIKELENG